MLYDGQRVLRALQEPAARAIGALFASGLLPSMIERGAVVGTRMLARDEERALYAALPEAALILEHERVPFIPTRTSGRSRRCGPRRCARSRC